MSKMKQFIAKIQSMFKGVLKDNVSAIKDILSNVPPEALFRIKGLQVPEYKVTPFPKSTDSGFAQRQLCEIAFAIQPNLDSPGWRISMR